MFPRSIQYYKFCAYGFLKNLRFFDVFLILFLKDAGLSYMEIGWLYSVRQIAVNIFEVPSGMIADLLGRKNALLFAFLSYITSILLFYISGSFIPFMISMFVFGIGEAFRSGTHKAMIIKYLQIHNMMSHKTAFYGHTRSWSQFGSAISSLVAMLIVFFLQSYRASFIFTIIPYLLDTILIASYPSYLNFGDSGTSTKKVLREFSSQFKELWSQFTLLFRTPEQFRGIFSAAAYIAFFKVIKDYLQPIFETVAIALPFLITWSGERRTAVIVGIGYFFIFLITSATARHAWRFEGKFKTPKKAIDLLYLWGVIPIGLAGLFIYYDFKFIGILFFVCLYVVQNLRRPMVVGYLGEIIDVKIMASGLSVESQFQTIIIFLFAPILGIVFDNFGIAGGLIFSSFIFICLFPLIKISRSE